MIKMSCNRFGQIAFMTMMRHKMGLVFYRQCLRQAFVYVQSRSTVFRAENIFLLLALGFKEYIVIRQWIYFFIDRTAEYIIRMENYTHKP